MNARDLSEPPNRYDLGMPPSVARSQLPKDSAHATKELPRTAPDMAFSERCCLNNTQTRPGFCHKPLFYHDVFDKFHFGLRLLGKHPWQPVFRLRGLNQH